MFKKAKYFCLFIGVVIVSLSCNKISERTAEQVFIPKTKTEQVNAFQAKDSDLVITFLGTGSPRPSLERYGPSFLVEAGERMLLIDAGSGTRERLFQVGSFDFITRLDHILITHLHYDHMIDIADLWLTGWLYGRRVPFKVYGPEGTVDMVNGLKRAFKWDIDYRIAVGIPQIGSEIIAEDVTPGVIYDKNGLKITVFDVQHMPIDLETRKLMGFRGHTFGFRVDYQGHSAVFSGDTRKSGNVIKYGHGADVLIHEVQVPSKGESKEANRANVSLSVHSTPQEAGEVFSEARPRLAVYSHIIPPQTTAEELAAITPYDGKLLVAHDLMTIVIGDEIKIIKQRIRKQNNFENSQAVKH